MSFYNAKESSLGGEAPYYDSDGNEYWEVERIVNKKVDPADGILKYEVKWLGYPEEDNTWEPLESLEHVRKMVDDFEKARIAAKNLPNKTLQSGKEPGQLKAAQSKNMGENTLEQKQNKKQTLAENESLSTPKVIESKKKLEGNQVRNQIDFNQNTPKSSRNDEHTKMFRGIDMSPQITTKNLESKSIPQPPSGVISKDKEIIQNGPNINLNPQQRHYVQGSADKVAIVNSNKQTKTSSGLTKPPNQSRYNHPNYSNLNSHDKIIQKEGPRELTNGGSEFDIISRTTGISGNSNHEEKKASLQNSSVLGELFHTKKVASKESDPMVIEDDDDDEEVKINANENIKREPMATIKSPLNTESQPVRKKSRFQDASEVLGREKEKLLDVPKVITRRESDKPTEKERDMNIEESHLRRTTSSNAEIPSQFPQVLLSEKEKFLRRESDKPIKNIEKAGSHLRRIASSNAEILLGKEKSLDVSKKSIEKERSINIGEETTFFNTTEIRNRRSRFQEETEVSHNDREKRRESEKSREKEENRDRERDQSEEKRSTRKPNDSKKRMKKKFYSESQPPQVEEEFNQSAYYEAIKEGYLKHDMNKNDFLEFLCPYGNFKDDKMERISKVFWEGKASANPDDYYFEVIWKTRSNGIHKAPTVVSWEDLLDGNPREAAKFSFGRLTKIFSNFGTLEE